MKKIIENGKTTEICFKSKYKKTPFSPNDEVLCVSPNDFRDDSKFLNESMEEIVKQFKDFPLFIYMSSNYDNVELVISLSHEETEELHRYIGEILDEVKTL